jgi:hypothetical protein
MTDSEKNDKKSKNSTLPADQPVKNTAQNAPTPVPVQPAPTPLMTGSIEWTASEYIENHKTAGWFIGVGMSAVLIAGILYFATKDLLTIGIVIVAVILFAITGAKKPRTLKYLLDSNGITIGDKQFPFSKFKSFAVINEGGISSVQLIPLKRFAVSLSIYYPPEQEDMILKITGSHLPIEDRSHDLIDKLMRKLNF